MAKTKVADQPATHVEHQGTVVEIASGGPGAEAVIQNGQGLVFRTEDNKFGTLGADGFYHGYVPSTQVRDILMGQGNEVRPEETTAMEVAMQKAQEQDAQVVAGSEAPFPTGDVMNQGDTPVEPEPAPDEPGPDDPDQP